MYKYSMLIENGAECANSRRIKLLNIKKEQIMEDSDLSRTLAYLLRHGARREGFVLLKGGYIAVEDILNHKKFQNLRDERDIRRIVAFDRKRRYSLTQNNGKLLIRANQGHSIEIEDDGSLMSLIESPPKRVIHGTTADNWALIKTLGLSRMKRNYIHFCESMESLSGFRKSSTVGIVIDVAFAMKDGIQFYRSKNDVILSSGDSNGIILPKYFHHVIKIK
jgi:2'-phosphotransferase